MGAVSPWHLAILAVVVVALFGAKRLPETARGVGQSLKILKSELRGGDNSTPQIAEAHTAAQPNAAQPTTAEHAAAAQPTTAQQTAAQQTAAQHTAAQPTAAQPSSAATQADPHSQR